MQKEILDRFTAEVVKQTQRIKLGDPLLEDTRMGPLINRPHLERVLGFVRLAREQVRARGNAPGGPRPSPPLHGSGPPSRASPCRAAGSATCTCAAGRPRVCSM